MKTASRLLPSVLILAVAAAMSPANAQTPAEIAKIEKAMPKKASAKPEKPRRILVFSQTLGYHHASIPYADKAFKIMGEKTGAFTADVSSDPAALDPANLAQYDAVLFNNPTGDFLTTPSVRQGLLDFVRGGKGLVGIHAAADSNYSWKEYGDLIGGWFDGHPWRAGDTVTLKIDQPGHPITKAFDGQSLEVNDEIYQIKDPYSRDKVLELISLNTTKTDMKKDGIKRTDGDFPVSWVHKYGEGRVFYTSLGHNAHIFWNPVILQHYLDGIQFAIGDLDAPTDPGASTLAQKPDVSQADLTAALGELKAFDFGKERGFLLTLDNEIRQSKGKEDRREKLAEALANIALDESLTYAARDLALRRLGEIGNGEQVEKIEALLTDKDERIAESARQTVALIPADRADKALIKALESTQGSGRIGLIDSLGQRHVNGAVDELTKIARQGDNADSRAAMRALGKIGTGKAGHALLDDIRPPDAAREAWFAAMNDAASDLGKDNKKLAERLFDRVLQLGGNSPARLAAFKGKALLDGQPEATALKALDEGDAGIGQVARELLVRGNDPSITAQLLQRLESADVDKKIVVVEVLGARGDKTALDAVSALAEKSADANSTLRVAAISALENLGDQNSVPMLLKIAATEKGAIADAAKTTLAEIPVPEVDAELLKLINSAASPTEQVVAIETVTERKPENVMAPLSEAAKSDNDKVAVAAFKAISELGTYKDLTPTLALHDQLKNEKVVKEAGRTIAALAKNYKEPADAVGLIQKAYASASSDDVKASLLTVLGKLGGTQALATIQSNLDSSSEKLQDAAVRALADFPDASALNDLMKISAEGKSEVHKVLALRGVARLLSQPVTNGPDNRLEMAKRALDLAAGAEEKKAVIGDLADMKTSGVLPVLAPYLDQAELKDESIAAIIKGAPIANQYNPGETAALLNPLKSSISTEQWNKLEEALTPGDGDGGSIRAWQLSEIYDEPDGTSLGKLLNKEYPAESADYQWPASLWAGIDDGDNKGKSDLLEHFPGVKTAAIYLRTHVWSPDDREARLDTGSDDGMRAWVNGDNVLKSEAKRGFDWWTDKTNIQLKRGWNVILLKVGQGSGDWAVAGRIVDNSGKPMTDLKYSALPQGE